MIIPHGCKTIAGSSLQREPHLFFKSPTSSTSGYPFCIASLSRLPSTTKKYNLYGFEEYYDIEDKGQVFDVIEVVL